MSDYFYSLYALATSYNTNNLPTNEHNEYVKFLGELQQEDCQ